MGKKPKKPDKKITAPIRELAKAIETSKKTEADTKALDNAHKGLKAADKELGTAMEDAFRVFDNAHRITSPLLKTPTPGGPVPIPYPVVSKAQKEVKTALGKLERSQKKHDKASAKLVRVLDKEIKTLKPYAKSSGDAAGTLKGLISAKAQAKVKWMTAASDVKVEGKNIVRHMDLTTHAAKKSGN